jgi:hypothetical protein
MRMCGRKRVLDGTAPEVPDLQSHRVVVLSCLPTAPGLPLSERRLRYVAAFRQLSGKRAACLYAKYGMSDLEAQ